MRLPVPEMLPAYVVDDWLPPTSRLALPKVTVAADELAKLPTRWLKPANAHVAPELRTMLVEGLSWLATPICKVPALTTVSPE